MRDEEAMVLLKRVSRSFYLSVRLLPAAMRRGVCVGYLLARASDTLADVQGDPGLLDAFERRLHGEPAVASGAGIIPLPVATPRQCLACSAGEQALLDALPSVLSALEALPDAEAEMVREVVATILSGQRLDMQRFASATADRVVALASADELDDYTNRVAGCVGQFWTRLGFQTLGGRFSTMDRDALEVLGIRFGKGLQLVNILRDTAEDLAHGRQYLPDGESRASWLHIARENLEAGMSYAAAMRLRRLRVAVALPAHIGIDTLDALMAAGPAAMEQRIKIPRHRVWRHLLSSIAG